ncbi:hypothetical protein N7509_013603 [Penicillium cosmopolitanum]|uniref:Arrestin-like N-terminal domain-containing protein n=1 Tax=Penicillium cosmopolitanum TaxID=1131564 RepID=A0A9W9SDM6_9EURO|nr:uncharacterized protein N7509_013603 [Penicillium cosmopolitanum]KAJ5376717.1 hypothetical protein N7509_013603 [Penicillium cosmopolitanum]
MTTIDVSHSISLNILLGDPPDSVSSYHYSYHAGDAIQGSISIRSDSDLHFESLDIFLIGEESTVRHDRNPRQFHHEQYPVPTTALPPSNIIQKNQKYFFRFTFQVPDTLSPTSCTHTVENDLTRQFHLQAPPSFGDPDVAGFGGKLRNDYAPSNCRIKSLKIRLKPSTSLALDQPSLSPSISPSPSLSALLSPLTASGSASASADSEIGEPNPHPQQTIDIYQRIPSSNPLSKSKSKSKTKIGQLTTTIIAPPYFDIPVRETDASVRQAIRLNLHFERESNPNPNQDDQNTSPSAASTDSTLPTTLPQIQSLRGSVVANTFFTKKPNTNLPRKKRDRLGTKLNYAEKVLTEFTHSITSLQWAVAGGGGGGGGENHTNTNINNGSSPSLSASPSQSMPEIESASPVQIPSQSFTSTLLVPVKLAHQFIIPTFHSCRISRTYTLVLRLKVQGAATVEIAAPMVMVPSVEVGMGFMVGGLSPPPYSFARSPAGSITSTLFDGVGVIEGVDGEGTEERRD